MDLFEIIMYCVLGPLFEFLERRHTSGKWRFSHLLPLITILCVGIWWLGYHWNNVILLVFGVLGTVLFGLFNLILWIPRNMEAKEDFKSYMAKKKRENEK